MSEWRNYADAAVTDVNAALTNKESAALDHLRDARANIVLAIEELEDDDDEEEEEEG